MEQPRKGYDYLLKLLLIGDTAVGKSSLILRFTEDIYNPTFISTIGIDFKVKTIEIDGKRVKLQVWDTAGQERYRTITTAYYRTAQGIILSYDVTNPESLENLKMWVKSIEQHASKTAYRILIGNKSDLVDKRQITTEKGRELANEFGIQFFETSAKDATSVDEAFLTLARDILKRYGELQEEMTTPREVVPIGTPADTTKSSGCCKK